MNSNLNDLTNHAIYQKLNNIENIQRFMEVHVFAVWDFMSLLKSLQSKIAPISLPWRPSPYPSMAVRLINEIVLGEESDIDQNGNPMSHYELYLKAMEEVGASTTHIKKFVSTLNTDHIPTPAAKFVEFNLKLSMQGEIEEVASAFLHGREKLLPEVFQNILNVLESHQVKCPTLKYYFKRHIDLDGAEHGPMADQVLQILCEDHPEKLNRAKNMAEQSLILRKELWDKTLDFITQTADDKFLNPETLM